MRWSVCRLVKRSHVLSVQWVSLGHASVQITLDRYGHLMDQSYGDASDRLEAALFAKSATSVARKSP
jgi:hypothetical protein